MDRTSVPCVRDLAEGGTVRVRLPRPTDRRLLSDLLERLGEEAVVWEAELLLRYDPQRRSVLVAELWDGSLPVVVGYAGRDHSRERDADVLIADEALAPGVTAVLADTLGGYVATRERHAA